jgi:hypothetical protein
MKTSRAASIFLVPASEIAGIEPRLPEREAQSVCTSRAVKRVTAFSGR